MITQDRLKHLLTYNPETGEFTRNIGVKGAAAGGVAGCVMRNGYIKITIDYKHYYAHRLSWFYVYGEFPESLIDHANGIKSDNRILNLRKASKSQNAFNSKTPVVNSSGVKGVTFNKGAGKWMVQIRTESGKYHGLYETIEEAKAKADQVRTEMHREFLRHS